MNSCEEFPVGYNSNTSYSSMRLLKKILALNYFGAMIVPSGSDLPSVLLNAEGSYYNGDLSVVCQNVVFVYALVWIQVS